MRARVTCAWLFVSAAACTPGSGGGGLPARYAFLGQSVLSSERAAELRGELPYERIELEEYNPWIWGGDRIELSADGSAEWLDAGRGRYAGEASIYDYGSSTNL